MPHRSKVFGAVNSDTIDEINRRGKETTCKFIWPIDLKVPVVEDFKCKTLGNPPNLNFICAAANHHACIGKHELCMSCTIVLFSRVFYRCRDGKHPFPFPEEWNPFLKTEHIWNVRLTRKYLLFLFFFQWNRHRIQIDKTRQTKIMLRFLQNLIQ